MNLSTKDIQMKNTLGKILFLWLISSTYIYAQENPLAVFELTTNKTDPYIKEAVEITFKARQKDHEDVMFFFVTPKKSDNYKIVLLNKDAKDIAYHDKESIFSYLLFPLKSGDIDVKFNFTIKVASDEAVAQVYRGSRDNVKWIETTNTKVDIEPLKLHVKLLKHDVDLVGDFKLSSKIQKTKVSAYESTNIKYFLEGIGYDEFTIKPIDDISGINLFLDINKHFNKATKDGYKIQREYNYALLANKDYTINSKSINCYSPKDGRYYTIKTKEYKITVEKTDISNLIDKDEYPKQTNYFKSIKEYLVYILIFFIGYISAKIDIKTKRSKKEYEDITNAQDAKELLYVLINNYNDKVDKGYLKVLEEIVYKGSSSYTFKDIKKIVLKSIKK